jgi:hypothetical protein
VALKQQKEQRQATQWQLGYQDLQQLGLDTSGRKAVLVRRRTEAGTAGEGAEQELRFNGFFSLAYGRGVAKGASLTP